MSYYLGKVGRAGARLVHSCRELYNDVNAAYLTGAVDVLVVRQRDGSLKSTPFHARFGKLGVLRTGDYKEVEITLNGKEVDLPMVIDETGKIFFTQSRPLQQTSLSMSDDDVGPTNQVTGSTSQVTGSVTTGNEMMGTRGNEVAVENDKSAARIDGKAGKEGEEDEGKEEESLDDIVIEMEHLTTAEDSSFDEVTSPESHVTQETGHMTTSVKVEIEEPALLLEGTLILTPRRGSDTEIEIDKREEVHGRSFAACDSVGGVSYSSSAHWPHSHQKSLPLPIIVSGEKEAPPTGMFSSLPPDLEVLSDSALDEERYLQSSSLVPMATALSDTEVEVKDRLSSKLWEWSADRSRHLSSNEKERRKRAAKTISTEEDTPPAASGNQAGFWGALSGMLQLRHQRRLSLEEGIYLDAIDDEKMDPQQLSQFFPHRSSLEGRGEGGGGVASSGIGSSPVSSSPEHSINNPHQYRHGDNLDKLVSTLDGVTLSLCGGLAGQGSISEEAFQNSLVSFADFNSNPEILLDPKLVVRVRGKYYPWQVAAPMIMSAVVFLQPLPDAAQSKLQKKYMPKKRQSFWSFWGRRAVISEVDDTSPHDARKPPKSEGATPPNGTPKKWEGEEERVERGRGRGGGGREEQVLSSDEEVPVVTRPRQRSLKRRRSSQLTNKPTSEQLSSLDLKPGANEMVFSITTKFQGTTKAVCTVYLWDYHDKVVISDIDGTITRSDVVGQVLPLVGMDWTQKGVIELFNAVARNGYKVLYLSARAIGQAGYTKQFLRRLSRGPTSLPDGPLFLTPSSLVTAFKKEVIEKRPYEFKIDCLQQVRALFPDNYCPLHAGFGNRHSDVKSYTQVGIPRSRIFTVNYKGHLKYEISSTFQSTYMNMIEFVDAQFPPVGRRLPSSPSPPSPPPSPHSTREEYSTFNFWRTELSHQLPFDL